MVAKLLLLRMNGVNVLKSRLIHPEILKIVGAAGHHSKILIADGNYPASSKKGPHAELVHLNLMPGLVTCNQVLKALLSAIPIECINTMMYDTEGPYGLGQSPSVWAEFESSLQAAQVDLALEPIEKWSFYDAVMTEDHVLTIQTADQQIFANLLLTIGVRIK